MTRRADDFSPGVKQIVAHRAGYRCSKPDCRAPTAGPSDEGPSALTNVGVAAHITAASKGGPRFDESISAEDRRSERNAIWLCQTHGKQVDDDEVVFDVPTLRAWKKAAVDYARTAVGRPIGGEKLDVALEVIFHRSGEGLLVSGLSNLPNGTRLMITIWQRRPTEMLGQEWANILEGTFAAGPFTTHGKPLPHACYVIEVVSYFNDSWAQPPAVSAITGKNGAELIGRFVELLHPELPSEGNFVRGKFECVAPPLASRLAPTDGDLAKAISLVRAARMVVDGKQSRDSVEDNVRFFLGAPGIREHAGWSAALVPDGSITVSYSFLNGEDVADATWNVVLNSEDVRYMNIYAKCFSYVPD